MDKRIILAKAGSGKTYHICNEIDQQKRNLIIAFTNRNISNILNEIQKKHGSIPDHTEVLTFHSFIYRNFIRPFELLFSEKYQCPAFRSNGLSLDKAEGARKDGKYNPKYIRNDKIGHYYIKNCEQVFLSRMSDLILKNKNVWDLGIDYIKNFFDYLYIDEVQDFRENDWKLLENIILALDNVVLVGDFFQHSVCGDNNSGVPFKKNTTLTDYKKYLEKLRINIDEVTLSKSRRCPKKVCEFVNKKTKISIEAYDNSSNGEVREITDIQELKNIIKDDSIVKLLPQNAHKKLYRAINWGNSKGDTYDKVLVVLFKNCKKIFDDDFEINNEISRNKLYVALTRTRSDLFIVQNDLFEKVDKLFFYKRLWYELD